MQGSRIVSLRTADGLEHPVSETRHPGRSYGMQFHTTFTENTAQLARKLKNGTTVRLLLILPE